VAAGSASAADLNTVDGKTTVAINAGAVTTLLGTAAAVDAAYAANAASTITGLGDEAVTLADTSLAAATLNTIDANTSGEVDASAAATLTGSGSDVLAAYAADAADASTGITGLGDETVELSDTTLAAATLNSIDTYTSGVVDATAATTLTGFASALIDAYAADAAGMITGLDNEVLTITGGTLSSDQLIELDGYTSGAIDATAVNTLTVDGNFDLAALNGDVGLGDGSVTTAFSLINMVDGSAGNSLTLNFASVFANVGNNGTMTIDGDVGDTVNLTGFSATGYDFDGNGVYDPLVDDNYTDGGYAYYGADDGLGNIVILKIAVAVSVTP
jgi:hypothetical protein